MSHMSVFFTVIVVYPSAGAAWLLSTNAMAACSSGSWLFPAPSPPAAVAKPYAPLPRRASALDTLPQLLPHQLLPHRRLPGIPHGSRAKAADNIHTASVGGFILGRRRVVFLPSTFRT